MNTTDTNTRSEHQYFKRTFLQQTEVIIKFTPALDGAIFKDLMIPYIKDVFNIDLSVNAEKGANHAEIRSGTDQKQFVFDLDEARFIIGPKSYRTFAESAIPLIGMLLRFMSDVVKSDTVSELSIIKINIWPINSEDAYSNFTDMIRYTFNNECVSDMLTYKFDENPKPVRLSKTSDNTLDENTKLDAIISAEVISSDKVKLGLVLKAQKKDIKTINLLSDAIKLNDIIYRGFMETISDNIINFMTREGL